MATVEWRNFKDGNPTEPGVYRTRVNKHSVLTWWRAWDGKNWRGGRVATINGSVVRNSPDFKREVEIRPVIAYVELEWIGFSKE